MTFRHSSPALHLKVGVSAGEGKAPAQVCLSAPVEFQGQRGASQAFWEGSGGSFLRSVTSPSAVVFMFVSPPKFIY